MTSSVWSAKRSASIGEAAHEVKCRFNHLVCVKDIWPVCPQSGSPYVNWAYQTAFCAFDPTQVLRDYRPCGLPKEGRAVTARAVTARGQRESNHVFEICTRAYTISTYRPNIGNCITFVNFSGLPASWADTGSDDCGRIRTVFELGA